MTAYCSEPSATEHCLAFYGVQLAMTYLQKVAWPVENVGAYSPHIYGRVTADE